MANKDLKKKTEKELKKELKEKQEALRKFRFGVSGSRTRNIKEGHSLKLDIARIKTALNSK